MTATDLVRNMIKDIQTCTGNEEEIDINGIAQYLMFNDPSPRNEERANAFFKNVLSSKIKTKIMCTLTICEHASSFVPGIQSWVPLFLKAVKCLFKQICDKVLSTDVRAEIEQSLKTFPDLDIRDKASEVLRQCNYSKSLLDSHVNERILDRNGAEGLMNTAYQQMTEPIKLLGLLMSKIEECANNCRSSEQFNRGMKLVRLYIIVTVYRTAIFCELHALVCNIKNNEHVSSRIQDVIKSEHERDLAFLSFLDQPDYSQAYFSVQFLGSQWPIVKAYMDFNKFTHQNLRFLTLSNYIIRPAVWPRKLIWTSLVFLNWLVCGEEICDRSKFSFHAIEPQDSTFRIRNISMSNEYVYMTEFYKFCRTSGFNSGQKAEWKIVRLKDGEFMLACMYDLRYFMYMMDSPAGSISGSKVPERQGQWIFEPSDI